MEFTKAREVARPLGLSTSNDYRDKFKKGDIPEGLPNAPNLSYKNKGWIGWGNCLGTGKIAAKNRTFLPFFEARKYIHAVELDGYND